MINWLKSLFQKKPKFKDSGSWVVPAGIDKVMVNGHMSNMPTPRPGQSIKIKVDE